jgi:hypothetical protein
VPSGEHRPRGPSPQESHLLVRAGGRAFAIPGSRIVRIARYEDADGLRVDLAKALGGAEAAVGPETSVVFVSGGRVAPVGLVVDEATGILLAGERAFVPPPDFGPAVALTYLAGLLPCDDDRFAIVLDVEQLLDDWKADA